MYVSKVLSQDTFETILIGMTEFLQTTENVVLAFQTNSKPYSMQT